MQQPPYWERELEPLDFLAAISIFCHASGHVEGDGCGGEGDGVGSDGKVWQGLECFVLELGAAHRVLVWIGVGLDHPEVFVDSVVGASSEQDEPVLEREESHVVSGTRRRFRDIVGDLGPGECWFVFPQVCYSERMEVIEKIFVPVCSTVHIDAVTVKSCSVSVPSFGRLPDRLNPLSDS